MNWLIYGGLAAALAYLFLGRKNDAAPSSPTGPGPVPGGFGPPPPPASRHIVIKIPIVPFDISAAIGDTLSVEGLAPATATSPGWVLLAQPTTVRPLTGSASQFAIIGRGDIQISWPDTQSFPGGDVILHVV